MSSRRIPPDSPYLVLRRGAQRYRAEEARAGGVTVARGLSNFMKPALGPRGVSKLLITALKDIIVTRDGAQMLGIPWPCSEYILPGGLTLLAVALLHRLDIFRDMIIAKKIRKLESTG